MSVWFMVRCPPILPQFSRRCTAAARHVSGWVVSGARLRYRRAMKYLHTMVRATDLKASLAFYCEALGLVELRRIENAKARFTLVFVAAPADAAAQIGLTWNWDPEAYTGGRNFGHIAYEVEDIYATCKRL